MIEIRNVSKTFTAKDKLTHACDNVSLSIRDGEIYGVIGYSGAGKSTLIRCINFLETPDNGSISVGGFGTIHAENGKLYYIAEGSEKRVPATTAKLNELRKDIGMIFQQFNLLDRSTVYENVAFPLKRTGKTKSEIDAKVKELLELVGLSDKINSYPSELSGGQKQRVAIARALANDPKILLSDEATSALDPDVTESILALLKDLNKKLGITIILITHEMSVIKQICEEVAVMENGRVVEQNTVYNIFAKPQEDITKRFVRSSSELLNVDEYVAVEGKGQRLVKLQYNDHTVQKALISDVSRKFNVDINILAANIEMLHDKPLGSTLGLFGGDADNIEKALRYLEENGVILEEIKYA